MFRCRLSVHFVKYCKAKSENDHEPCHVKNFQLAGPVHNLIDPSSDEEVYPYLYCIEKDSKRQKLYCVKIDKTNRIHLRIHLTFSSRVK